MAEIIDFIEYKQNRDPNKATSQDKKGKETKIATGAKRSGITTCKAGKWFSIAIKSII